MGGFQNLKTNKKTYIYNFELEQSNELLTDRIKCAKYTPHHQIKYKNKIQKKKMQIKQNYYIYLNLLNEREKEKHSIKKPLQFVNHIQKKNYAC